MKKVGIALLGLGVVGSGTYRILESKKEKIMRDFGVELEVRHVLEKDTSKAVALGIDLSKVSCDIENVVKDDKISVVAEFFGGIEPARTFLLAVLKAGKSIVTSNKELFSKHWPELEAAAKETGAGIYFEASCGGGVPIIRALHESCQGNDILEIKGIVNGTTNYILSNMSEHGSDYAETLKEAQKLGYAEANPSADVDGFDSTYKLSILSSLAFNKRVPYTSIYREGISKVTIDDIKFGKEFGLTVKLLAISKNVNGKIEAHVYPAFIPDDHPLAKVSGAFNGIYVVGDNVGELMFYGKGAGDLPTGSAIVSDIVYAATRAEHRRYPFILEAEAQDFNDDFVSEYFLRLTVKDETGVLSAITGILGKAGISIDSMVQKAGSNGKATLAFVTQKTTELTFRKALSELEAAPCVTEINSVIRVEK
ncbi:MAG: homoserine dehydrogenase [Clostridia bacterium]|nr:homoserine dehydrogenase [Clostridia bacterium]